MRYSRWWMALPGLLPLAPATGAENTDVEWSGYFKLDMARDSAVSNYGNYINGTCELAAGLRLGLELARWTTRYIHSDPGFERRAANLRLQRAVQGDF